MPDRFQMQSDEVFYQARRVVAVSPSDSTDLTDIPKALWVSVAGTVTICGADDSSDTGVSLGSLSIGTLIPVRARRVKSTGTTATVVALY